MVEYFEDGVGVREVKRKFFLFCCAQEAHRFCFCRRLNYFSGILSLILHFSSYTHSQHTAQFCSSAFYLLFHGDLTCHHHYQCVKMCKERPERQEGKQVSFIFSVYSHFIIITIITTLLTCCKYNPYKN